MCPPSEALRESRSCLKGGRRTRGAGCWSLTGSDDCRPFRDGFNRAVRLEDDSGSANDNLGLKSAERTINGIQCDCSASCDDVAVPSGSIH